MKNVDIIQLNKSGLMEYCECDASHIQLRE